MSLWQQIGLILAGVAFLEVLMRGLDYMFFQLNNLKGDLDEEE
jgi:hypothetical protein